MPRWQWQSRVDLVQFNWFFLPFFILHNIAAYKMKRVSINKQQHMNADVSALDLIYTAWGSWEGRYVKEESGIICIFFILWWWEFSSIFNHPGSKTFNYTPLDQRKVEGWTFLNFIILNFKHVLLILLSLPLTQILRWLFRLQLHNHKSILLSSELLTARRWVLGKAKMSLNLFFPWQKKARAKDNKKLLKTKIMTRALH